MHQQRLGLVGELELRGPVKGVLVEIGLFMIMAPLMQRYSLRGLLLVTYAVAVARFLMIGWGASH